MGNLRAIGCFALASLGLVAAPAHAQSTCGDAVAQLQNYASQVNQIANYEYSQGIAMRCGWNQQCGYYLLAQLQQWYQYQANAVNNWYMQIARQCSPGQSAPRINRGSVEEGLDEGQIEELEVDDEDRTVALRIPDNPRGFRPR